MVDVLTKTILLFASICICIAVNSYPRDEFRVTATAMLTADVYRRDVQPTPASVVSRHRRSLRKIVENYYVADNKGRRYFRKRSLPLENPHPDEDEIFQPKVSSRRVHIAAIKKASVQKKQVAQSTANGAVDTSDDGNFDPDDVSDVDAEFNEPTTSDEDEDDDDEASPTEAGLIDSSQSEDSDKDSSKDLSDSTKTSSSEKADTTSDQHYDFNDDEDDTAEAPDDASSPTDTPARKENIHPTQPTNANRKTEIEKTDPELETLLQLENDIDDISKSLPTMSE